MSYFRVIFTMLLVALVICCVGFGVPDKKSTKNNSQSAGWNEELNGLNYLVMRTSSINLVNGLYLSREQAMALYQLSLTIDSLQLELPDKRELYSGPLAAVGDAYFDLIGVLLAHDEVSDTMEMRINEMRILEADIIKRSLLAAETNTCKGIGCLECHAPPSCFDKGGISNKDTKPITNGYRAEIDLAHVKGLFGEEGTMLLWDMKEAVDSILTNEQKYVFSSFRCCLIPPRNSGDPGIIGQSFVTNEWIDYFKNIRELSDKQWLDYKDLFFIPLRDILKAKLPGIKKKDMEKRIAAAEKVILIARGLDKIDFELQKENLCIQLSSALSIDALNGESMRSADERKFMAALFLLFPGTSELYHKRLTN